MAPANTDRNLLFGILALQMDFISRDGLIKAMNTWVLEKTKGLGQILLEQQALGSDEHALLEALVQKHLQKHGNDAEQSLAAVSSIGSVREELQQIADADLQASLAHVSQARQKEEDSWATVGGSIGTSTSTGLRFRILRPHARGGLGQVSVAHDEELHREVALKEIQEQHADEPNSRARFLLEAEITGGLEHPGIVPVYGLGTYADGRPYYAMRFIRGDSLKQAIERFHQAEGPKRDPGQRRLQLRDLLGRFVDACNAVAYAHSRGILHRDLKPGNIMLGQYGETLVVDWGLAKPLDLPERIADAPEGFLKPASASGSAPTQMGSALGTPAYMSPEQAAGRLDLLGPASDVYSQGATLHCLLTGKPAFRDAEAGVVLQKVQSGDFPRPRQVKSDVPAALEAICLNLAESSYLEALNVRKPLAEANPKLPWLRRNVAWSYNILGYVQNKMGRHSNALKAYQESLALARILNTAHPEVMDYATLLGSVYAGLGNIERDTGQPVAGIKLYEKALHTLAPVLQKNAHDPDAREEQREAYAGRAAALNLLGRQTEALADWDHAIELASGLVRTRLRRSRALTLARSGDHVRAAAEVDELAKGKSLSGTVLCDLARSSALAAVAAGKDGKLTEADKSRFTEQHAVRAIQFLRQARDAGYFQDAARVAKLKSDPDFASLRSRAEFKKLLAELEGPPEPPKK